MMQNLPYKDFKYCKISLDNLLNTPNNSYHGQ